MEDRYRKGILLFLCIYVGITAIYLTYWAFSYKRYTDGIDPAPFDFNKLKQWIANQPSASKSPTLAKIEKDLLELPTGAIIDLFPTGHTQTVIFGAILVLQWLLFLYLAHELIRPGISSVV